MHRFNGLTLLELLLVLALFAVLSGAGVAFGSDWITRQRAQGDVQQLVRRAQQLRLAAIKAGHAVTWCPARDGLHCGGDWSAQQIAFIDRNADQQFNADEQRLAQFMPLSAAAQLKWRGFASRQVVVIEPSGVSQAGAGRFTYQLGRYQRKLIMSRTGRLRVE